MRRATLMLMLLIAACGDRRDGPAVREAVQTADLTGLYEGPSEGEQRDRMCMVSETSGAASFGIVAWTEGGACSGSGEAVRQANDLRFTMAGAEECVMEANVEGTQVTLPPSVAESCAYYCSPGASFAGKVFKKTGGTAEAAMRATDLAGDPLCG